MKAAPLWMRVVAPQTLESGHHHRNSKEAAHTTAKASHRLALVMCLQMLTLSGVALGIAWAPIDPVVTTLAAQSPLWPGVAALALLAVLTLPIMRPLLPLWNLLFFASLGVLAAWGAARTVRDPLVRTVWIRPTSTAWPELRQFLRPPTDVPSRDAYTELRSALGVRAAAPLPRDAYTSTVRVDDFLLGRHAVTGGAVTLFVAFTTAMARQGASPARDVLLVALALSALFLVLINSAAWDWRPAYALLFAALLGSYVATGMPSSSAGGGDLHSAVARAWTMLPADALRTLLSGALAR